MNFLLTSYNTPNKSHHLRARGNLTYLDFIRLVEYLWSEAHPDIPFFATGGEQYAKYPCIVYGLELRKTHSSEPKPKYREEIITGAGEDGVIVGGQRFQNVVSFSAVTETDPRLAEELIEVFEDFIMEFTPVFKELGLSEIIYNRRFSDSEENRPGQGIVKRTVSYMITTEKIILTYSKKLNSILVRARTFLETETAEAATPSATPISHIFDQHMSATPSF